MAAGLGWGIERARAVQLRLQLEVVQRDRAELSRLEREHRHLLERQPSDEELARLQRELAARQTGAQFGASHAEDEATAPQSILQPGTWARAADWKNRGRATPAAALETMLWASAGGDLTQLKQVLEFDEASQAMGAAMFARLPAAAQQPYATPEDLLALMVAGNIPLDSARLVTRQILGDDDLVEFVRLKSPDGTTRQVHLALHRSLDGWKLRVPAATVGKFVGEPSQVLSAKESDHD